MRRLVLILCLTLGGLLILMSGAALTAKGIDVAANHSISVMVTGKSCADCPDTRSNTSARACAEMGTFCGIGAGCGVTVAFAIASFTALPSAESLTPPLPALSQAVAQQGLVPEPPPPRA
ncbi:MAG: hypothetical protein KGH84_01790 [Paracoccaceae bacterium]|nr:hypothetical protein [Paracoccaceae bacterium]